MSQITVYVPRDSTAIALGANDVAAAIVAEAAKRKLDISLEAPADTSRNCIAGTVSNIGYLGNLSVYHVTLPGGREVKATQPNRTRMKERPITWDDALARAQKGLVAIAYQRAVEGKETIIFRRGEEYERRISPSDAMLSLLVKRGDLAGDGARAINPETTLTFAEQRDGWVFNVAGKKVKGQRPDDLAAQVEAKLHDMRIRIRENELRQNACAKPASSTPHAQGQ